MNSVIVHCLMKNLVILIVSIVNVETVPPEYCLHPLNTSDCRLRPTQVFSYYKSGSRCEIELWRGCPTLNKFANQYECTDMCIYNFGGSVVDTKETDNSDDALHSLELILEELPTELLENFNNLLDQARNESNPIRLHVTLPPENETEADTTDAVTSAEASETTPEASEPKKVPATAEPKETAHEETVHEETVHEETVHEETEPPATDAPATTKKESDESGLPEEVELA